MIAIVDSGPLYAAVDADDNDHKACLEVLQRTDLDLIIPALVVAEVTYLVGRRLGPAVEAAFLRSLASVEVEPPIADDWPAMAALVEKYGDLPLGGTDASVAVLSERLDTDLIITLDRRHFGVLRTSGGAAFTLLPN